MTKAALIRETGGPSVIQFEDIELGEIGADQVLVRHTAIGVNFLDVYFRSGQFKPASFPFINGFEAAGVIEEVGSNVADFQKGDRVAYQLAMGAYTEARLMTTERLVRIPDFLSDTAAAAVMMKGMTAEFLVRQVYAVGPADVVLVHAAAGGVGQLVSQWARALGATVIGTVSSPEKADIAKLKGCHHTYLTRGDGGFVDQIRKEHGEQPVSVIYDGVGKATFAPSISLLRNFGWAVLFGWASGRAEFLDPHSLQSRSLTVTSPSLGHYTSGRERLAGSSHALFEAIQTGVLTIDEPTVYPLADAAEAHADLEGRRSAGSLVLVP